jgi:RimJ/RimL family protein N-acetyltransferase
MFKELSYDQFERVQPLFAGFDYSLSIRAAMQGHNPGRIFVNDVARPRTAFALTVEGYLLTGEHDNPATLEALHAFIYEKLFTGEVYVNGDDSLSLAVYPEAWEARLPELISTHEVEKLKRYHYLCRELAFDWRAALPPGYTVRRVDQGLLKADDIIIPEAIAEWTSIEDYWGTVDNFLANGVGFCVLHDNQIVAQCMADCVADEQMDIGITTAPAYRRKGLAAIATAATVEHCLTHGFKAVGWHCNAENVGSWKTAEKVGFKRNREYAYYFYIYDLVDHWAELGWLHFQRGAYRKTVQYYEQVFAARDDNPDYYYHLAALAWANRGDVQKALHYLNAAVGHGWTHAEWTRQQPGFAILHGLPEWERLLAAMNKSAVE